MRNSVRTRWPMVFVLLGASTAAVVQAAASLPSGMAPCSPVGNRKQQAVPPRLALAAQPIGFEENRGQADARARFVSRTPAGALFLTETGAVLSLPHRPAASGAGGKGRSAVLSMGLVGARRASPAGVEALPGRSHYFRGSDASEWRPNVTRYRRVRYPQVYPGIDLVFHDDQEQLEYDFVVAPDADPAGIAVEFSGARRIDLRPDGSLALQVGGGTLTQRRPVLYQEIAGQRRPVAGSYRRLAKHRFGFQVGQYDRRHPLVIDPVISFSTYLGGSGSEGGFESIAVGADGCIYLTSESSSLDYPIVNPGQAVMRGRHDVVVSKLDPSGGTLLYSTYLGGSDSDLPLGLAVDRAGQAYVVGRSLSIDYPVRNAVQPTMRGVRDWIITKLTPDGSQLVYSTYLGSGNWDEAFGVVVDAAQNAYVAGTTGGPGFPTWNAMRTSGDGFLAKLNAGGGLVFGTYLVASGGRATAFDVDLDPAGNVYVTGVTNSTTFPTTPGAYQPVYGGGGGFGDAFLMKLNAAGSQVLYSSYLGGSGEDRGWDVSVDGAGNAYILGETTSRNFPVTGGAVQPSHGGGTWDAFVTRLSTSPAAGYFADNLEFGPRPEWSSSRREGNGNFSTFSGRFGRERQRLTVGGLTPGLPHFAQFDLYIIDSWDGNDAYWGGWPTGNLPGAIAGDADYFNVYVDGLRRFHHWFWNTGANTYGTPNVGPAEMGFGNQFYARDMIFRRVTLSFTPSGSTSVIEFEGEGLEDFPGETWGIDNVVVRPTGPLGSSLLYSSYLGGSGDESVGWSHGLAVDPAGGVHVAGHTTSVDFPVADAVQPLPAGGADAFAALLAPGGAPLIYSTYFGGSGWEVGVSAATDGLGSTYLVGLTGSTNLPTHRAAQAQNRGGADLFVARLRENSSPVANAGSDQSLEATGPNTAAQLDGSASFDPDGYPLAYDWRLGAVQVGTVARPTVALGVGSHTLMLTVRDPSGASSSDTVVVRIVDSTPPTVTCPPNVTQANDAGQCSAVVNPGAAQAVDLVDGNLAAAGVRSDGRALSDPYPVGTTTLRWTATDAAGNSATCSQAVTVLDSQGPVIAGAAAAPNLLWPPNHKLVTIRVNYTAADNCDPTVAVVLTAASSEPDNGLGDGDTAGDIEVVDAHTVRLRAERSGAGNGRIYTLTLTATDSKGNSSSQAVTVSVPKSQGK